MRKISLPSDARASFALIVVTGSLTDSLTHSLSLKVFLAHLWMDFQSCLGMRCRYRNSQNTGIAGIFFGNIILSNSARAKINSAELFERGTEVDQVYFNPGYSHSYSIDAKEHRQRKNTKGPPLCFVRTYLYLCLNAEQLNKVNVSG